MSVAGMVPWAVGPGRIMYVEESAASREKSKPLAACKWRSMKCRARCLIKFMRTTNKRALLPIAVGELLIEIAKNRRLVLAAKA